METIFINEKLMGINRKLTDARQNVSQDVSNIEEMERLNQQSQF